MTEPLTGITELRHLRTENKELRAQNAALRIATDEAQAAWASTSQVIEIVQEQNAMLVAALKSAKSLIEWLGTPSGYSSKDFAIEFSEIDAALASVKGECNCGCHPTFNSCRDCGRVHYDNGTLASVKGSDSD